MTTTVAVNLPQVEDQLKTGQWAHGLCGCFDNLGICIVAYFVPCVTFGQTRENLTGDGCVLYVVECNLSSTHYDYITTCIISI